MSAEEIIDWMAYETSISTEFEKRLAEEPKKLSPEEEADAIFRLFNSLGSEK